MFLASDISLQRQVVIKVLTPEMSAGVSADRFRREIQLVAKLQHPHVVPILSAGEAEGALYYVMPYIAGESLRARLARDGPMSVNDTLRILRELLDALAFAHKHGVTHRDIKPDNILIGAGHAVVADFGVSKALKESGPSSEALTSVGVSIGTPAYMAPEQATADPATDHRADLYAVGVVAYEMLTGEPPFSGTPSQLLAAHISKAPTDIRQRRSDIPDLLANAIMRALEKEPRARPQSAAEMMTTLHAASMSSDPRRATNKRALTIGAGVAVLAVVAIAGTWYTKRAPVASSAQSIAITPFAVADGDTALVRLGQNLVTTMSANLDGVGEIRAADAMSVLSHAKGSGGLLTLQQAANIARKVGVRGVLYGTLARAQRSVRADVALYHVDSLSAPIARMSAAVPLDSVSALTDSLTWGLLREVWRKGKPPTPNVASIRTHNPAALREFLEGERQFARGAIVEASDAYARAVTADTAFWFAAWRYRVARDWYTMPSDTTITQRLARHLADLPDREAQTLRAHDSTITISDRIRKMQAVLARDPDYLPALLSYADVILHHGTRAGYEAKDAIAPFVRLTQLVPTDFVAAQHLTLAYLTTGDLVAARAAAARYDSLVRSDPKPSVDATFSRGQFAFALNPMSAAQLDSLDRETARDTIPRFFPDAFLAHGVALILPDRSDLFVANDKQAARMASRSSASLNQTLKFGQRTLSMLRGESRAVDSLTIDPPAVGPLPFVARAKWEMELSNLRARVLLELQGLLPPISPTADRALAASATPGVSNPARVELEWIAAANALKRGDSAALRTRVTELSRDTSLAAKIAGRSLRALGMGFGGNTVGAADSLLVLEREHGDLRRVKVWGAFGADRLFGAQWLTMTNRFAPADSLLRFSEGLPVGPHEETVIPLLPAVLLERSRIAEGMGNTAAALRFAESFLAIFDKAPDVAKPRIEEAKQRVERLRGGDVKKSTSP